jgi:hypothetical protein
MKASSPDFPQWLEGNLKILTSVIGTSFLAAVPGVASASGYMVKRVDIERIECPKCGERFRG